jgi:hypothetical protein
MAVLFVMAVTVLLLVAPMAVLFLVMAVSVGFRVVSVGALSRTVLVTVLGVAVPAFAVILGVGTGSGVIGFPVGRSALLASAGGSCAEGGSESDESQPAVPIHGFSSTDGSPSDPPVRRSRSAAAVW